MNNIHRRWIRTPGQTARDVARVPVAARPDDLPAFARVGEQAKRRLDGEQATFSQPGPGLRRSGRPRWIRTPGQTLRATSLSPSDCSGGAIVAQVPVARHGRPDPTHLVPLSPVMSHAWANRVETPPRGRPVPAAVNSFARLRVSSFTTGAGPRAPSCRPPARGGSCSNLMFNATCNSGFALAVGAPLPSRASTRAVPEDPFQLAPPRDWHLDWRRSSNAMVARIEQLALMPRLLRVLAEHSGQLGLRRAARLESRHDTQVCQRSRESVPRSHSSSLVHEHPVTKSTS